MKIDKENRFQDPIAAVHGPDARWPDWWNSLSSGERKIICSLMRLLRGAKRSQLRDVARAAAEWERGIGCFIKVRLMTGHGATGGRNYRRKHLRISVQPGNPQRI
jgi:hypothetical protein